MCGMLLRPKMRSTFFRTVESTSAKRRMKRPLKQVGNRLLFQKSQNEINNSSCIQRFYSFSAARGRQQGEALRPDSPPDLLLDLPNRRLRPGALRRLLGLRNFSSVSKRLPTVQSKTKKKFFPTQVVCAAPVLSDTSGDDRHELWEAALPRQDLRGGRLVDLALLWRRLRRKQSGSAKCGGDFQVLGHGIE